MEEGVVPNYEIDVCMSFASERRAYVADVARILDGRGVKIFYDAYEEANLWGKGLYEHLDAIYRTRSRYCVLFASKEYAEKVWTTHERKSAQARAIGNNEEYILPARFDDTEIPGVRPTVGYVDLRLKSPSDLADLIVKKLATVEVREPGSGRSGPDYSTAPTTTEERNRIISLKPSGWEYFLFGGIILEGQRRLRPKRQDCELGYATAVRRIDNDRDASKFLSGQLGQWGQLSKNILRVFDERAQVWAFGPPGQPGKVENIVHLGHRFIDSYEAFLDWAADIRGTVSSKRLETAFELTARLMDGSIRQIEWFIDEYVRMVGEVPGRLARGERTELNLTLTLTVDRDVTARLSEEMDRLKSIVGQSG